MRWGSSGSVDPANIPGTTTNNNAALGTLGEIVTATVAAGAAVALTTATSANVTSISVTAGDWDIFGQIDFALGATTSITQLNAAISLTTGTLSTQPGGSGLGTDPATLQNLAATVPAANVFQACGPVRLSVAATTTVYLVANATFTVSTCAAFGTIRARRVR